jgi:hypothetical protein
MAKPFVLSIEPVDGRAFQYGYHLGTDERLARRLAAEEYHARNGRGERVCTVALMRDRRIVDVYDGAWRSAEAMA